MSFFHGKTALVTGAASGIGAACAKWLADQQIGHLVLVDLDRRALEQMTPSCACTRLPCDVSDPASWSRAAETLDTGLDFAVLNAGVAQSAAILDLDFADWRRVMRINLDGAMLSLQAAMRAMQKNGGAIVLTASVSGLKAQPGTAAYAASKAGVIQLAKVAALEGAARKIRVNTIAPGGVDTPIWDGDPAFRDLITQHGSRDAALAAMAGMATPLGRFATAEEIATQVGFLLSEAAATITGTVLVSDGGYSA